MALHFVRFPDNYGRQYQNAVRVFGRPHFMHRLWDQRARREIAEGDVIVFAKGDEDQPVSPYNGDDEYYSNTNPIPRNASPAANRTSKNSLRIFHRATQRPRRIISSPIGRRTLDIALPPGSGFLLLPRLLRQLRPAAPRR